MAELDSGEFKKKKNRKRDLIKIAFVFLVVIFCVNIYNERARKTDVPSIDGADFDAKVGALGQGSVLGEGEEKKQEAFSSSESFSITQLSVNGGVGLSDAIVDFESGGLLVISNIKSELYTIKDGEKDEVKAIISCQTNKKTSLDVEYQKSAEKNTKIVKDKYLSLSHTVVLSGLEPDSVYRYSIKAKDSGGNIASSDQFVFYTGAPNISLMDVLSNATQKVFGWAMKK